MTADPLDPSALERALAQLRELRAQLRAAEVAHAPELAAVHEQQRQGARNLVHYVTFREHDVRPLQEQLAAMGLSSLGRSEARIDDAIASVARVIERLLGRGREQPAPRASEDAALLLRDNARRLLGPGEPCVIMVTLPSAAAHDGALVRELLRAGMSVARVNCAHDDDATWRAMVEHVQQARAELGVECRILFDLPGPKLRTMQVGDDGIALSAGDTLLLTADGGEGRPARRSADGSLLEPARVACALPEALDALVPGAPVFFDDGKIEGSVVEVHERVARIAIRRAGDGVAKLRSRKGINLPETELAIPALAAHDLHALDVAARDADMVGFSFVRTRDDVLGLHRELEQRGSKLGVVLKIETKQAFEQLPSLLLTALRRPPVGVMIARGDLAVECGFERLAELQEEILWLCEAAHVPCIWATQVLETLAKKGRLTRAEITDAAMAERAECVMLNKGPHVVRAVETLRDIIARMRGHQRKKTALLRPLRSLRLDPEHD